MRDSCKNLSSDRKTVFDIGLVDKKRSNYFYNSNRSVDSDHFVDKTFVIPIGLKCTSMYAPRFVWLASHWLLPCIHGHIYPHRLTFVEGSLWCFLVFCSIIDIIWACSLAVHSVVLLCSFGILSIYYVYCICAGLFNICRYMMCFVTLCVCVMLSFLLLSAYLFICIFLVFQFKKNLF